MSDDALTESPAILKKIQSTEQEIKERLRAAEEEAAAMLKRARSDAESLLADKREIAEERRNQRLAKIKSEAAMDAEKLLQKSRAEADAFESLASKRLDEAVDHVLQRILPMPSKWTG